MKHRLIFLMSALILSDNLCDLKLSSAVGLLLLRHISLLFVDLQIHLMLRSVFIIEMTIPKAKQ